MGARTWRVRLHSRFVDELLGLPEEVRTEIYAAARRLETEGPMAKRPFADTLKGSKYANMKELRLAAGNGTWRVAFAFDPIRQGIVLVAGSKASGSLGKFYRSLIAVADRRFGEHLGALASK